MKTTILFRTKQGANSFGAALKALASPCYTSVYVMGNRYACTASGDFTQEQIEQVKPRNHGNL